MPLLSVADLDVRYETSGGTVHAVDRVSLDIEPGETVGLVGDSGCGKSTLAKTILRLVKPAAGHIVFEETDLTALDDAELRPFRQKIQMIFQDPFGSLNPRHSIGRILTTPLKAHGIGDKGERLRRAKNILSQVGLPEAALSRYPHEFSGGQRQRIGIARALVLEPRLIVCDEPVSALDLSIQAQILNLLGRMKREFGLSYLFISHDLSVVQYFSDRILVMYLGRIIETGDHASLRVRPRHPYTRALLDAVPSPANHRQSASPIEDIPKARAMSSGCRFHPRCPLATAICMQEEPALREMAPKQSVACHHAEG